MDDQRREQPDNDDTSPASSAVDTEADGGRAVDPAEQQRSAEEFAQEHDPAKHDVAAGADARQPGDWTADDAGGPQVWNADGKLVEGDAPGLQSSQRADGSGSETGAPGAQGDSGESGGSSGPGRTSSLDEVRDGGYGVGSAATIDDGAVPMGHPVKAWEDTKTFVSPGHDQYDAAQPHLWFTDDGAAERAGFRPID